MECGSVGICLGDLKYEGASFLVLDVGELAYSWDVKSWEIPEGVLVLFFGLEVLF